MYSPLRGSGGMPSVTTEVTNTLSPQTTGDDQPRPGMSVCQRRFLSLPQTAGSGLSPTPASGPPRNAGHDGSAASAGKAATNNARSDRRRMGVPFRTEESVMFLQYHDRHVVRRGPLRGKITITAGELVKIGAPRHLGKMGLDFVLPVHMAL